MNNVVLFIVFLGVSVLYFPLNLRPCKFYWKTALDDSIPLIPAFIFPYLTFFPFIALAILGSWSTRYSVPLLLSLILAKGTTMVFWFFVPNGVRRPLLAHSEGLARRLLLHLYRHDNDGNAFPSSHVFVTWICAYFLSHAFPTGAIAIWIVAMLIVVSTVFTKQHYVIDIVGGTIVAICVLYGIQLTGIY